MVCVTERPKTKREPIEKIWSKDKKELIGVQLNTFRNNEIISWKRWSHDTGNVYFYIENGPDKKWKTCKVAWEEIPENVQKIFKP